MFLSLHGSHCYLLKMGPQLLAGVYGAATSLRHGEETTQGLEICADDCNLEFVKGQSLDRCLRIAL